MDKFARAFVVASLIYSVIGACLGVCMAWPSPNRAALVYDLLPTHVHINLVGWVSMMIYGVSYHVIPRFSGRSLYSRKMAWAHFALAQAGLIGMAVFFVLDRTQGGRWEIGLAASGTCLFASILLFASNMLMTMTVKAEVP